MNRIHHNSAVRARAPGELDGAGAAAFERIGRDTGIQSRSLEYVDMVVVGGAHRLTSDGIRSAGIYRVRSGRNSRNCDAVTFNVHDRNVTGETAPTALRDVCSHIISYYERGQRARPQAGTLRHSPAVWMRSPAVRMRSPAVWMRSPAVRMRSPAVWMRSPAVWMRSPAVWMRSPAVRMRSPAVRMPSPAVRMPSPAVR